MRSGEQRFQQIGMFGQHGVVNGNGTGNAGQPPDARPVQAHQPDHFRPVGVQFQIGVGFIAANGLGVHLLAVVAHVGQRFAVHVLADRRAHQAADQPEGGLHRCVRQGRIQTAQQHEATSGHHLLLEAMDVALQRKPP